MSFLFNFRFPTFLEVRSQVFRALGKEPTPLKAFYIPQYFFVLFKLALFRFVIDPACIFLPYWFVTAFSFALGALGTIVYNHVILFPDPISGLDRSLLIFFESLLDSFILETVDFLFLPYYLSYGFFIASKFYGHKLYVFLSIWGGPYFWWFLKWVRYYVISWLLVIPIARHVYIFLFGLVQGRFEPFGTLLAYFCGFAFFVGFIKTLESFFFGQDRIHNRVYFYFFKYYYLFLVIYKTFPSFIRTPLYYVARFFYLIYLFTFDFLRLFFFWFLRLLRSLFPTPFFPRPFLLLFPLFPFLVPLRSLWSLFLFLDQSLRELSQFLRVQCSSFLKLMRRSLLSITQSLFSLFKSFRFRISQISFPKFDPISRISFLYKTYYPIIVQNLPQAYGWITFFLMVLRNRIRSRISSTKEALLSSFLSFFKFLPYYLAYIFIQAFTLPFEFFHFNWYHRKGFRHRALHRSQMLMQYKFYYLLKPLFRRELPRPQFIIAQNSTYMCYLRDMTWDDTPRIPFYVLDAKINYVYLGYSKTDWAMAQRIEWDREERFAEKKYFPNDLMFRPRTHREMWHYCRASLGIEADKKKLRALLKANPPLRLPRCIISGYVRPLIYHPWEPFWEWEVEEVRKKTIAMRVQLESAAAAEKESGSLVGSLVEFYTFFIL